MNLLDPVFNFFDWIKQTIHKLKGDLYKLYRGKNDKSMAKKRVGKND